MDKNFNEKYESYTKATVWQMSDEELCNAIEEASDWEVCDELGLLDELTSRVGTEIDYEGDSWESEIDEAIKSLRGQAMKRYEVDYYDYRTGATSPVDNIEVEEAMTVEQYVEACKSNGAYDDDMYENGEFSLIEIED